MVAAQQEVRQVKITVESRRKELVGLMRQRLLLRKNVELEAKISDIRKLISDTEDLWKELFKAYKASKIAFERVLEHEKLDRASKSQDQDVEQQNVSGRVVTDGVLSGRLTQKEPRRVQVQVDCIGVWMVMLPFMSTNVV